MAPLWMLTTACCLHKRMHTAHFGPHFMQLGTRQNTHARKMFVLECPSHSESVAIVSSTSVLSVLTLQHACAVRHDDSLPAHSLAACS
jgi:hypothetical protein